MPLDLRPRSFREKFSDAFRGLRLGSRGQSSFTVHWVFTLLVLSCGLVLHVGTSQWCLLILCITIVLAAEFFNSALERLAKAVDEEPNQHIGAALDIASAAVLVTASGAAIVGLLILIPPLLRHFT
jgi:diacylglycerol kinase